MLAPVRVTPPAITPVSLAEVKADMHIEHDEDDAVIVSLIGSAVDYLDGWRGVLGYCLCEQTWRQDFVTVSFCLPLQLGPVIEIVSVDYAVNGLSVPIEPEFYTRKTDAGGRTRVEIAPGVTIGGAVSVTYVAGHPTIPEVPAVPGVGDDPGTPAIPAQSTAPEAIKRAIITFVRMNYLPLKPEERASYERTFDALIGVNRKVGV